MRVVRKHIYAVFARLQNYCHSFCESVKSCLACPVPSIGVASMMPELNYLLCPDDFFEGPLVTLPLHFIHYLEVLLQRCIVAVHNANGPYELCMCGQSSSGQTVLAMPRDVHTAFPRERFLCFKRNGLQYMCKRWVCILCFTVFNLRTCSDCPVWKACSVCLN